ncbi:MAG TPA: hypothetical protein VHM90_06595 [Phycisphaerae bacterium]|nr:hypothetical protein [Phycisphaerae bacterium]
MTDPAQPLSYYGGASSRYQAASWVMLLIMGIFSLLMGACVSLAAALIYWGAPALRLRINSSQMNVALAIATFFCLMTFTEGALYLCTCVLVRKGSRRATRVAWITAICAAAFFAILLGVDVTFLIFNPPDAALLPRIIFSLAFRLLCIGSNSALAWLLTRRLRELTPATSAPAPAIL